jgi:hypothetical protein
MSEFILEFVWMLGAFYLGLGVLITYLAFKPTCRTCAHRGCCPRRQRRFSIVRKPWCVVNGDKLNTSAHATN